MEDSVVAALAEVLARRERGRTITEEWVRSHYPRSAEEILGALRAESRIPGRRVRAGPYRLLEPAGAGGMGEVWRAVAGAGAAVPEGAEVAVKLLHPWLADRPALWKRALGEVRAGLAVRHGNVVRTEEADYSEVGGRRRFWIAMEYVAGGTLRDGMPPGGLAPEAAIPLARDIAAGLSAIHAAGAVHRDLKPENILVRTDGAAKIADLGLAKLREDALSSSSVGLFAGTALYAAPETFAGARPAPANDLYSLGMVLFEVLAGRHPFRDADPGRVLERLRTQAVPSLLSVRPDLDAGLAGLVDALLREDPAARPPSAGAVLRLLPGRPG